MPRMYHATIGSSCLAPTEKREEKQQQQQQNQSQKSKIKNQKCKTKSKGKEEICRQEDPNRPSLLSPPSNSDSTKRRGGTIRWALRGEEAPNSTKQVVAQFAGHLGVKKHPIRPQQTLDPPTMLYALCLEASNEQWPQPTTTKKKKKDKSKIKNQNNKAQTKTEKKRKSKHKRHKAYTT